MIDKNKIQQFEDLPVWQDAQDLAVEVYTLSKFFPDEENYALVNQLRRAVSSISANIAEGFGRKSSKDKLQFYRIAYGSLLEVKNFIYLAHRLNYINDEQKSKTIELIESLQKQLNAVMGYFNGKA
ncbi:MAG: four helix bundle protein [Candidatus Saccharimonadales bacterium]